MSDETPQSQDTGAEDTDDDSLSQLSREEEKGGKIGKMTLISLSLIVLLCAVGGGLWVSGVFETDAPNSDDQGDETTAENDLTGARADDGSPEDEESANFGGGVFYELPEMLVNLNTGTRRTSFLKIRLHLELGKKEDIPIIEETLPRIADNLQVYLRELRPEDLKGSSGIHRLREELLKRLKLSAEPVKIHDILFKELLVQ